jgi:hypothetical protein
MENRARPARPASLGRGNDLSDRRSGTKGSRCLFVHGSSARVSQTTYVLLCTFARGATEGGLLRCWAGLARAVHDFCTARDRGLAVSSGVWVSDLVEAKAPLGLAVLIRIACSVHVDWLCRPMIQQGTYTHTWVLGGIWYSLHCTRYIRDIRGSGLNGTVEVLWNEFNRSKMCERQLGRRGGGGVNDDSRPSTDKYLL